MSATYSCLLDQEALAGLEPNTSVLASCTQYVTLATGHGRIDMKGWGSGLEICQKNQVWARCSEGAGTGPAGLKEYLLKGTTTQLIPPEILVRSWCTCDWQIVLVTIFTCSGPGVP